MSEPQTSLALPEQGKQSAEIIRSSAKQTRLAAFTPANLTEAIALAKMMASSEIVPKAYRRKPADILVAIQFGSEIGLAAMQSLQSIAVINGNPSLWGDAALALCQGHPEFEDISETTEGTTAKCVVKRKGRTPVVRTFSDEDAQKAGLLTKGGTWNQYRQRMRQLRARGFALRDSFADVLKGIKIAEEVLDIPEQTQEKREPAALDVAMLTPSQEQNRGHEDTGLGRNGKSYDNASTPREDAAVQKSAKELSMCSECREIGKHKPDCKYAAQDSKEAQFTKAAYMLKKVDSKKKKDGTQYLVLSVVTQENVEGKLYVWHGHLKPLFSGLDLSNPAAMIAEVSQQQTEDKKTFFAVEHVQEIAGKQFVDDKPAEQSAADSELF